MFIGLSHEIVNFIVPIEISYFFKYIFVIIVMFILGSVGARVRTHNQNMTVAARAIADRKTLGHRS